MKPKIGLDQCHGACTVFMNLQLQNPAHGFCDGRWPLHPDKAQNSSWIYLDGHWSDEAPYIVGCNAMQTKGFNRSYCTVVKVSEKAFAAPGKDPSAVICNQTFAALTILVLVLSGCPNKAVGIFCVLWKSANGHELGRARVGAGPSSCTNLHPSKTAEVQLINGPCQVKKAVNQDFHLKSASASSVLPATSWGLFQTSRGAWSGHQWAVLLRLLLRQQAPSAFPTPTPPS